VGKYTKYKSSLPRMIGGAPPEDAGGTNFWNDEVEQIKARIKATGTVRDPLDEDEALPGATKEQLSGLYLRLRELRDDLEKRSKHINKTVEAIQRLLVERLESDGASSVRLADGGGVDLDDQPYSSVEDPRKFIAWVKAQGMEDMLTLHWGTMNATVKQRLEAGLEPPPGVKVFLKTSIKRRKPKGEK
jgi:hypothetical protein